MNRADWGISSLTTYVGLINVALVTSWWKTTVAGVRNLERIFKTDDQAKHTWYPSYTFTGF